MFSLQPLPSLPKYPGPYNVGSTEFEIPISEIDPQASRLDPRISTVKFRLFYPTDSTSSKHTITWTPPPQKQWIQAFSSFLGTSFGWSSLVNPILSIMNHVTIPAISNASLRRGQRSEMKPLAIFSHGLAGNCNMYSAICGSLASCGVICAAVEHRDGSSPVSWILGPDGKIESEITYRKYSHNPTPDVFNGRNAQLRIRLWELDLIYSALIKLDKGESMSNYASEDPSAYPSFKSSMDFTPGHVSWVGHSFGAATITQFVKSIYYHSALPSIRASEPDEHDWTPLYTPSSNSNLEQQITPNSPIALLDVWTLALRAPSAQWLWEKPFPCYDRDVSSDSRPNTVAIMSTEFYNYTDIRKRTQALLSPDPVRAEKQLAGQKPSETSPEPAPSSQTISTPPNKADKDTFSTPLESDTLPATATSTSTTTSPSPSPSSSRNPSPASSTHLSAPSTSPSSSATSLSLPLQPQSQFQDQQQTSKPSSSASLSPKLYNVPFSAHLSQSDFNLLFPAVTRVLMKAVDPKGTIILNVRAITQVMRNGGLEVRRIDAPKPRGSGWFGRWSCAEQDNDMNDGEEEEDRILSGDEDVEGTGGRWVEIGLVF